MSSFPGVLGTSDCTHVPNQSSEELGLKNLDAESFLFFFLWMFRQLAYQIYNFLALCAIGLVLFMIAEYLVTVDY